MKSEKIVVGISGASGSIYAQLLLDKLSILKKQYKEVAIVMSKNAKDVWEHELGNKNYVYEDFKLYDIMDFYAPFASGSSRFDTFIIIPCSMGTLAKIATGTSSDLMSRAADVILKERRKLICVVRETPYNLIQINNMQTITQAGGIICPATPSFYSKPQSIEALCSTVVDRVLDLCGFEIQTFRWNQE